MKNKRAIIVVGILMVILFIVTFQFSVIENENKLLKTLMIADKDWSELTIPEQKADMYYDLAGYDYEDGNYKSVESNCIIAREYYMDVVSGFNKMKAEMVEKSISHILIDIYIDLIGEKVDMSYNMYEACEHFEAAARSYDSYDYDVGGGEIEMMNEKIIAHDDAVERYNKLMSEYSVELKKLE